MFHAYRFIPTLLLLALTSTFNTATAGEAKDNKKKPPAPADSASGHWLTGTIYAGLPMLKESEVKKLNMTDDGAKQLRESGAVTLKGLAVRLGDKGEAAACYKTYDPSLVATWTGGFITTIKLMSRGEFPTALGEVTWFDKHAGSQAQLIPLITKAPAVPAHWRGFYVFGNKVILSYEFAEKPLLELPEYDSATKTFYRNFSDSIATFRIAPDQPDRKPAKYSADDFKKFTSGGPLNWPETVETQGVLGKDDAPYTVDTLTLPYKNPYNSEMQVSGFDFFSDGRAAICTFGGDVWIVSGIDSTLGKLTWKRFAAGLYHPLGLKIVNDQIYTLGRDQITRLHDLNKDGEADFYENFNNDIQITSNFHEFAFDLQTDPQGNFYFSKAGPVRNGGRGFQEINAHHGCLFKLTPDGKTLSVVATGFRAPNGIGVGPNGELSSGDNEGTWMPMCRLNWIKPGGFYGVPPTSHKNPPPTDYDRPICWFPKEVDNSSGAQVWDTTGGKFGPFAGQMFHLSYGTCSLFHVMMEEVDGQMQGGVVRLPLSFNTGTMRARFNPKDNALYIGGLKGWQTSGVQTGGFQRVRFTGKPVNMPADLRVLSNGIKVTFTAPLNEESVKDTQNYGIEQWNYIWSEAYGSPDVSVKKSALKSGEGKDGKEWSKEQSKVRERDSVAIKSATLLDDKKTIFLEIPEIQPVMQMKIKFNLKAADGSTIRQEIINTINKLGTK